MTTRPWPQPNGFQNTLQYVFLPFTATTFSTLRLFWKEKKLTVELKVKSRPLKILRHFKNNTGQLHLRLEKRLKCLTTMTTRAQNPQLRPRKPFLFFPWTFTETEPQQRGTDFTSGCINVPTVLTVDGGSPDRCRPKIEKLCWSRSCRRGAFIEWVILLTKLGKMSGQSSCAVIALISRSSQTWLQSTEYSVGVEPLITLHTKTLPPSTVHNLIVRYPTHWTQHD